MRRASVLLTGGLLALLGIAPPALAGAPGDPARDGGTTVQVAADLPPFTGRVTPLSASERRAMTGPVWRRGCPVGLHALRALRVRHVGFDGQAHDGVLVLHRAHAGSALRALRRLYVAGFPIRRMQSIERYAGDDFRSIEAGNSSAFNCRRVTGRSGWSEHAYGRAIDLNPLENPYVSRAGTTSHRGSRPYLDRRRVRPGMATPGSIAVRAFAAEGWRWGGHWSAPVDLQHFSPTGR